MTALLAAFVAGSSAGVALIDLAGGLPGALLRRGPRWLQLVAAHQGPIDVVLTDVVMPGTAPAVLVEAVRTRHPRARVIYMSGHAPAEDAGAIDPHDFLAKPFTMTALLRMLQTTRS